MATLNYTTYVSEIATLTAITSGVLVSGDGNFSGIMDAVVDYAEGRIYRDLDLPAVTVTDTSVSCVAGNRSISLSTTQGDLLVIDSLNIFSSAGTTSTNATRVPLVPTSKAVIDTIYPSAVSSNRGVPEFFARYTDTQIVLGPTPDQAYGTEVIATIRPSPLSATNSSTWLTKNLPELMIAAGMVFASGYMQNYGAQVDNPQMPGSWETQYKNLVQSAMSDIARMKFEGSAWTSQNPSPHATPPRA